MVASILCKILESKIEEVIEDQFEFRKDKGTRNSIELMRITLERVLDVKEETCLCFIDRLLTVWIGTNSWKNLKYWS